MTRRDMSLWFANALGPIVWFLLLSIGFYVVPPAHETGRAGTLHLMHVIAIVLTAIAVAIGAVELRRTKPGDAVRDRRRFMAMFAIGVSGISLLIVVGMLLTTLLLSPGAEP